MGTAFSDQLNAQKATCKPFFEANAIPIMEQLLHLDLQNGANKEPFSLNYVGYRQLVDKVFRDLQAAAVDPECKAAIWAWFSNIRRFHCSPSVNGKWYVPLEMYDALRKGTDRWSMHPFDESFEDFNRDCYVECIHDLNKAPTGSNHEVLSSVVSSASLRTHDFRDEELEKYQQYVEDKRASQEKQYQDREKREAAERNYHDKKQECNELQDMYSYHTNTGNHSIAEEYVEKAKKLGCQGAENWS